ncbi:MAG: cellulose synthase/poly-beta-1,6-N-acetylglucosamine synthase-like glycosyltransferase [Rickettsiales bacterium]|jgi:cellulose synthase/poly-beta-1,6-N-acetylglucosamine synthase-like glycosyltransferase
MRKIFLIFGVIFTVASAIIFNFFISKNDVAISVLSGEVRQIDVSIDSSWNDRQFRWLALQSVLISSQKHPNIINNNLIKDTFNINQKIESIEDLINIETVLQRDLQNRIDQIFIDRIGIVNQIDRLASKNDALKNIANLLNIIGLTLILVSQYHNSINKRN